MKMKNMSEFSYDEEQYLFYNQYGFYIGRFSENDSNFYLERTTIKKDYPDKFADLSVLYTLVI